MLPESENQRSAIIGFHSQLYFLGNITLENSLSKLYGGAILATSSTLWVDGAIYLTYNAVVNNGGAMYLEGSTLEILGICEISQNRARRGAGILASASVITVYQQGTLSLHDNTADEGGGIYLEANSKLYLSKSVPELDSMFHTMVLFSGNHANYGGAVYVADGTNNCKNAQECPLQTLIRDPVATENRNLINIIFSESNSATVAGSNLYGMLLA